MRVKVTQTFRDKDDYSQVYRAGEERVFSESRAQHLISLGLVERISANAQENTPKKRNRKPAKQV